MPPPPPAPRRLRRGRPLGPAPAAGASMPRSRGLRHRLYVVIFLHDTPAGRTFDIVLLVAILGSVAAVIAESVESIRHRHGPTLLAIEWAFTILFTIEYALRLTCVRRPLVYARSFFGVVDLLTILPTYLSLLVPGAHSLIVIRALRLLRVFRVLRLTTYLVEADYLKGALRSARRKITVFVFSVLMIVLVVGASMYVIEGPANGFTSIPIAIYWAIVTLTTVGYGDVSPKTPVGQTVASALMIVGYGIIAVPTGIVTAELVAAGRTPVTPRPCARCTTVGHDADARFCKACGATL